MILPNARASFPLTFTKGAIMKEKILLIDDDDSIQLFFRDELEEAGYEVHSAFSGEEALKWLKIFTPDLIILDIKMPGEDGRDTLREIKQINKEQKVVLCSAYPELKHDFRSWAADGYITKSNDLSELKAKVHSLLVEKSR